MRAPVGEALIIEGVISNVRFSPQKDKAYVEFEDEGNFVFEFNNKKKPRADHVKKLRLKKGERVIAIGAVSGASNAYGFGYDIQRKGKASKEKTAILRGSVEKFIRGEKKSLLYLKVGEKEIRNIVVPSELLKGVEIGTGHELSCLCQVRDAKACQKPCKNVSLTKCAACAKKDKQKRFFAVQIL